MDEVVIFRLGRVEYDEACRLQEGVAAARAAGTLPDALLLLEHPAVITIGRGGGEEDILAPAQLLQQAGVRIFHTDRGGRATYHGPGQLVAYPIFRWSEGDLHEYAWRLEEVVIRVLRKYGLAAHRMERYPGVWVNGRKIAAIGIAVREGITRHGLALNVSPNLSHFDLLIPCGIRDRGVTSMEHELGKALPLDEVADRFVTAFAEVFGRRVVEGDRTLLDRLAFCRQIAGGQPQWLWRRASVEAEATVERMEALLADLRLHTVCQEARCPNLAECFGRGTATFLILGNVCTRGCRFCAVIHGKPGPPDPDEPERVAEAAGRLGLRHVVVTSVTRDDLPDGGAGQFAATIRAVHRRLPGVSVEVLVPDFGGSLAALETVLEAGPEVLNHNVETVPRLYPRVRPGASYRRSLGVLAWSKAQAPKVVTKSGLMLGLGERVAEVIEVLRDLRQAGCEIVTLGQYLQPTDRQLPVVRYVPPVEFAWYEGKAREMGFRGAVAGPLVRSSYRAEGLLSRLG